MTDSVRERYRKDPQFMALVDMLSNLIYELKCSPTEVREAAMLAVINYEMMHQRPFIFAPADAAMEDQNVEAQIQPDE